MNPYYAANTSFFADGTRWHRISTIHAPGHPVIQLEHFILAIVPNLITQTLVVTYPNFTLTSYSQGIVAVPGNPYSSVNQEHEAAVHFIVLACLTRV